MLATNLILSVFFVGTIDASIYSSDTSKKDFIITPGLVAYENGLNNFDATGGADFRVKDNIVLPPYSVSPGEEDQEIYDDISEKDKISYYIVQAGDNVSKIAKKFGVSKNTIILENNLNSKGFLKLKQKLTILPVSGISYRVKKGDSLAKIAKNFGVEVNKIKSFNDLKDDSLTIGESIIIPGGEKKVIKNKVIKKSISKKIIKYSRKLISKSINKNNSKISSSKLASYFTRPSNGRFTSPFGWRWGRNHDGVDFAAKRGSSVVAAANGKIVKVYSGCRVGNARCGGGYGNHIDILHSNGYKTRYAHLIKTYVVKGQSVVKGQLIGGMGNTGHVSPKPSSYKSTKGTHLHFEIIKPNGYKVSPNFLKYK